MKFGSLRIAYLRNALVGGGVKTIKNEAVS